MTYEIDWCEYITCMIDSDGICALSHQYMDYGDDWDDDGVMVDEVIDEVYGDESDTLISLMMMCDERLEGCGRVI